MSLRPLRPWLVACVAMLGTAGPAQARFATRVFARVPAPGYPANAIVGPGGLVYAGTFKPFTGGSYTGPSKVFAFDAAGRIVRTYTITGQATDTADAVQVSNVDRHGTLYLLDQDPARVLKLDPQTGRQRTWATFSSPSGNPPEPDFSAWGPDGALYVTDYNQALVWRVPPQGGPAQVWLSDPRLNGVVVGPAGIELMPDRHTLMLDTGGGGVNPSTGKLYTVPILGGDRPGELRQVWESAALEAPDGFAIARSGNIYVALVGPSGNAVVEVSPTGAELARISAPARASDGGQIPFDAPGSAAFDGTDLLVGNQSSISQNPANWAIFAVDAGEPGLPLSLPPATPAPSTAYRLAVNRTYIPLGATVALRFRAVSITSGRRRPLAHALIVLSNHRGRTDRTGRLRLRARGVRRHVVWARLIVGGRTRASVPIAVG